MINKFIWRWEKRWNITKTVNLIPAGGGSPIL